MRIMVTSHDWTRAHSHDSCTWAGSLARLSVREIVIAVAWHAVKKVCMILRRSAWHAASARRHWVTQCLARLVTQLSLLGVRRSVRPSVSLSHLSTAATACAVQQVCCCGPGGQEISINSGSSTAHSSTTFSSKCEQCHVVSWRRKLNTDLLTTACASKQIASRTPWVAI